MADETQPPAAAGETQNSQEAAEAPQAAGEGAPPAPPTPAAPGSRRTKRYIPPADQTHAVGRRKRSVARVYLRPGNGQWKVNGRTLENYFPRAVLRQSAEQAFGATATQNQYDVKVNVNGGGIRGQADAIRLGVARALLKIDPEYRRLLRAESLLTRDAREVERKKPGRPKARKRFQFSKR